MSRHEHQKGLDKTAIKHGKVTIVGDSQLAELVLAYCIAMGVRWLRLIRPEFALANGSLSQLGSIENIIGKMSSESYVGFYSGLPDMVSYGNPDILIDATNSPYIKEVSKTLFNHGVALKGKQLFLSASSSGEKSSLVSISKFYSVKSREQIALNRIKPISMQDYLLKDYASETQGFAPSAVTAALITDEIRKYFSPLHGDVTLARSFNYQSPHKGFDLEGLKVAVVGAGGTGTSALLSLAHTNVAQVDIFDDDTIEISNLNRQFIFFESDVGKPKADIMVERLSTINPSIKFMPHNMRIYKETAQRFLSEYDIIFSCVDNELARKNLSRVAAKRGVVLIDSGVDEASARVEVFIPGKSYCQNCMHDYQETENLGPGCTHGGIDGLNTIVPNVIAGTLMVELAQLGDKHIFGAKFEQNSRFAENRITLFRKFPFDRAKPIECPCRDYVRTKTNRQREFTSDYQ